VITGYNTDVEYDGVVYHVQTEDKGLQTPVILSLVYTGGAILASKRSPYDDLISRGLDESVLTARLQRQHKLICAAVHAGRIEDLKRMSERDSAPVATRAHAPAADVEAQRTESGSQSTEQNADDDGLVVRLIEERGLRGGQTVDLHLLVTRAGRAGREPAPRVPVIVKVLGTTFAPQTNFSTTDDRGMAAISISLPDFKGGRAAILVQAESDGETAELRRIIFPSKS
jgi:hypothetical protein